MTYINRTQRLTENAADRLAAARDSARRDALVRAIGALNRNREISAVEILREILEKDALQGREE